MRNITILMYLLAISSCSVDAILQDETCTIENTEEGTFIKCPDGTETKVDTAEEERTNKDGTIEKIMYGSWTIENTAQIELLDEYTKIVGNIRIRIPGKSGGLNNLKSVTGSVTLDWSTITAFDGLRKLETVGSINLGGLGVQSIDFPSLRRVDGDVSFIGNQFLTNCYLQIIIDKIQSLDGIGGRIIIQDNFDPCADNPCTANGKTECVEDCSEKEFYTCN